MVVARGGLSYSICLFIVFCLCYAINAGKRPRGGRRAAAESDTEVPNPASSSTDIPDLSRARGGYVIASVPSPTH